MLSWHFGLVVVKGARTVPVSFVTFQGNTLPHRIMGFLELPPQEQVEEEEKVELDIVNACLCFVNTMRLPPWN